MSYLVDNASKVLGEQAVAQTAYDQAKAAVTSKLLAIRENPALTAVQRSDQLHAAENSPEFAAAERELAQAISNADELFALHASTIDAFAQAIPGQWSDRLKETFQRAESAGAVYQRGRDAITSNRLSASQAVRDSKGYGRYVARNSSTAIGKNLALGAVALQTKSDRDTRKRANDKLSARQAELTARDGKTKNGPAPRDEEGRIIGYVPLSNHEKRELARLRKDEASRSAENRRLEKQADKAEAQRKAHLTKHGPKMAADHRKLADKLEKAAAPLLAAIAKEGDPDKLAKLMDQLAEVNGPIAAHREEANRIEHELETGKPPAEDPKPADKKPQGDAAKVPPGCPGDYKVRCCAKCGADEDCECLGSSAGGGGEPAAGASASVGATIDLKVDTGAAKPDGSEGGTADPSDRDEQARNAEDPLRKDAAREAGASADGGGEPPSDQDFIEAAEAWAIPELLEVDLAEAAVRWADELWQRVSDDSMSEFTRLLNGGDKIPGSEVFDALTVASARRIMGGLSREQWMARQLPARALELDGMGWQEARAAVSREFFEREFPSASRDRDVFELVKRGPKLMEYLLTYPGDTSVKEAVSALRGESYSLAGVSTVVQRFDWDVRNRARADRESGTPKWYETLGYVISRPGAVATFGLVDPVEWRDDFGVGGATAGDMRREALSNPLLATAVIGGELAGATFGFGKAVKALKFLGFGGKTASALTAAIASGVSEDGRRALAEGDLGSFALIVGRGALSAGVGAKLGQYAKLLGPIESAGARGALLGAIGGAFAGAMPDPKHGATLEAILTGAFSGAMGGAAGGSGTSGGRVFRAKPSNGLQSGADVLGLAPSFREKIGKVFGVYPDAASPTRQELLAKRFMRDWGVDEVIARELAKPYPKSAMGEHFVPRRWGPKLDIPEEIMDSRLNVLRPTGISKGEMFELHYKVDRRATGFAFGPGRKFAFSGADFGLQKYGTLGRVWYGTPGSLKIATTAGGTFAGYAGYEDYHRVRSRGGEVKPDGSR